MERLDVECGDCNEDYDLLWMYTAGDRTKCNDEVSLLPWKGGAPAVYVSNRKEEVLLLLFYSTITLFP